MKNQSNSKRKYELAIHESVDGITNVTHTLDEIMFPKEENAFEYMYALQDIIDKVMDIPSGHAISFQPNRDNNKSLGIIARID